MDFHRITDKKIFDRKTTLRLNLWLNKLKLLVKLFAVYQHQIQIIKPLRSSSNSIVFWFSPCISSHILFLYLSKPGLRTFLKVFSSRNFFLHWFGFINSWNRLYFTLLEVKRMKHTSFSNWLTIVQWLLSEDRLT